MDLSNFVIMEDKKNIQKDYIDLRYECHDYSITLTQDDTLYIFKYFIIASCYRKMIYFSAT